MKNKGFSLIELLIVISLMGIVYGLYFFTIQQNKKNIDFSLKNMQKYIYNASKVHGINIKLVYHYDKKIIYLINEQLQLLDSIDFNEQLTQYILKKDEILEVAHYNSIEIDNNYFEPSFIYEMIDEDILSSLILNTSENKWLYFDTYFNDKYHTFINQTDLINFIKKKDYLPMYAGKPE